MKTIKIFFAVSLAAVLLSACSESWLDTEPTGSTLTQEQFDQLGLATIDGQVLGLYSLLDQGGSDHSAFGQKTVDMVTDIMASDMAMTNRSYGWFVTDAQLTTNTTGAGRNHYFWSYYYTIIKNSNIVLKRIVENPKVLASDANLQANYAQALSMRAYAYMGLYNLYLPSVYMAADQATMNALRAFPIYTELSDPKVPNGPASALKVQERIISDLDTAIRYFETSKFKRSDKLYIDATLAKAMQAKFYLEIGNNSDAYELASDLIDVVSNTGEFGILPIGELLTDGFNDYSSKSWIWGANILPATRGALRSFWGHMDVYTYSYAQAGAIKAIDKDFFDNEVKSNNRKGDQRVKWFNRLGLNPYAKFFTEKCDRSIVAQLDTITDKVLAAELNTKINANLDRDWLSDIVYMRVEELYLIAAEAAARDNDLPNSVLYLGELLAQRYINDNGELDAIRTKIRSMDQASLLEEIKYNWRIEFWGEGRSSQVMKRFGYQVNRGANHFYKPASAITPTQLIFAIPSAEVSTNPGAWM